MRAVSTEVNNVRSTGRHLIDEVESELGVHGGPPVAVQGTLL